MSPTPELRISETLALPLDLVTQTVAILAKRGMGKTYTGCVLVEEMLQAGLHVVVCDPLGVWWGLLSNAAGDGPGLPIVILGGDHAHAPLDPAAGEAVAKLVVDQRLSVVLDLSHLEPAEQCQFMAEFCEALFRHSRAALHLVFDEADLFAPQQPEPSQRRSLRAVDNLARRGRVRGIGLTLISQRPAVLAKNALSQTEILIVLRLTTPHDSKAIEAWVHTHGTTAQRDRLMGSLATLEVGEAWVSSPGWLGVFERVRVRKRATFDSSATPKVGETIRAPQALAPVDLAALREHLAAVGDPAESDNPETLRARIHELETLLRDRPATVEIQQVQVPVFQGGELDRLSELLARAHEFGSELLATEVRLRGLLPRALPPAAPTRAPVPEPPAAAIAPSPVRPAAPKAAPKATPKAVPTPKPAAPAAPSRRVSLQQGERKVLVALARMHPQALTRQQLGTLTGYAPEGGAFQTKLANLQRAGLIEQNRGLWSVTERGLEVAGGAQPLTTAELVEMWEQALKTSESRMLRVLVNLYPASISRPELAKCLKLEASGGAFGGYLSALRKNGLTEDVGRELRANPILFPQRR